MGSRALFSNPAEEIKGVAIFAKLSQDVEAALVDVTSGFPFRIFNHRRWFKNPRSRHCIWPSRWPHGMRDPVLILYVLDFLRVAWENPRILTAVGR